MFSKEIRRGGGFPNRWFIMKMDDLGYPYFRKPLYRFSFFGVIFPELAKSVPLRTEVFVTERPTQVPEAGADGQGRRKWRADEPSQASVYT